MVLSAGCNSDTSQREMRGAGRVDVITDGCVQRQEDIFNFDQVAPNTDEVATYLCVQQ